MRNRAAAVIEAIESVRTQTYSNLEIVVVDDGSTDGTPGVVAGVSAREPRLTLLTHAVSRGAQGARNTGIRAAKGEWLGFLDSDDTYRPESVAMRLALALHDGVDAVHGEALALRGDGLIEPFGVPPMMGDIHRDLLSRPGPMFQAILVRADCVKAIEYLDESIVAYQEWDTAIRLSKVARFAFLAEPSFTYDLRGNDTISTDLQRSARGYEQVVKKHARAIVRSGGLASFASHLREIGRQYDLAGDRGRAWSRLAAGAIIWPFGARSTARLAGRLLRKRERR